MTIFGFVFGLLELAFLSIFILAMIIGTVADRNSRSEVKWIVLVLGAIALVVGTWGDWTFASVGSFLVSKEFWLPVAKYLGLGVVYALVEFLIELRRTANAFKTKWENFLSPTQADLLKSAETKVHGSQQHLDALEILNRFITRHSAGHGLVGVVIDQESVTLVPKIYQKRLVDNVAVWTLFWPFYAVSLVFNNFIQEVFEVLGRIFRAVGEFFLKYSFKNVFKI
jgi:hypothetical protein